MKKKPLTLALAAVAMGAPCAHADALLDGERMIEACLGYAASQKFPPLSVGVIDASGALVAFKRQDGASSASAEAALLKARTAMRVNAPTDVLGPAIENNAPTRDAFLLMELTTLPGGIPVPDRNGRPAGAIGVSGSTAGHDVACARRGIEAVRAKK